MQVVVDGLLTNYTRQGKGRVILMLHGWGDSSKSWLEITHKLSKDFEVINPDLPGFGGTQMPNQAWGLDEYANFAKNFLTKISAPSLFAVIGHSNGGAIALRGVAQNIIEPAKLVLLSSAGVRGEAKGRLKIMRYIAKTGKLLTTPLPKNTKNKLRQKTYDTIGSDMLVAEKLQETFKKIVTDDVRVDAEMVTIPTLIVYGENDTQTPIRYGHMYHQLIEGSLLEILPNAGHFLQIDRPKETLLAIEGFLR